MNRCEDNIDNWECGYCEITVFMKLISEKNVKITLVESK